MKKTVFLVLIILTLIFPVSAQELEAPAVPDSGVAVMPDKTGNFGEGLNKLIQNAMPILQPNLVEASGVCVSLIATVLLVSFVQTVSEQTSKTGELTGAAMICVFLLKNTNAMISLGSKTVFELSEYEKILLPVLASAIAAQGGITSAATLYAGTMLFITLLGRIISSVFIPALYLFLASSAANSVTGEGSLAKVKDILKGAVSWSLKIIITVFTSYIGISGVVSGTTDAATLKATKVTIASLVPIVGGILSEASEAVLVGAGLIRNSVGLYGIFAILSIYAEPFITIGVQYLALKYTAVLCSIFGSKKMSGLIDDFSAAMGMLLAMTGSMCVMLLVSSICFLKGIH